MADKNGYFLTEGQLNDIDRIMQAPHYDDETKANMIRAIKQ